MSDEHDPLGPEDVDRVADYLSGRMNGAPREEFEARLLVDDRLACAVYEEVGVDGMLHAEASRGQRTVRRARRGPVRRWWWTAPMAAAVIIFLWMRPSDDGIAPVYRGDAVRIDVVGPTGRVAGHATTFVWRPIEGARTYEVQLFDAASRRLFREATVDTFFRPASDLPETTGEGFWRVVARDSLAGRIGVSDPVPLTVDR